MAMEIFDANEALDRLAEKSNMFKMIKDDFDSKNVKIAELGEENINTMMALTEVYEQLILLQMGGTL